MHHPPLASANTHPDKDTIPLSHITRNDNTEQWSHISYSYVANYDRYIYLTMK